MGKYSNVNYSSLISATETALAEIGQNSLLGVKVDLSNTEILNASVAAVLTTALESIETSTAIKGSIAVIKTKLLKLKDAAIYIGKYQDLEDTIAQLEAKKYTYKTEYDEEGNSVRTKKIDYNIVNQINTNNTLLQNYENTIDQLLMVKSGG